MKVYNRGFHIVPMNFLCEFSANIIDFLSFYYLLQLRFFFTIIRLFVLIVGFQQARKFRNYLVDRALFLVLNSLILIALLRLGHRLLESCLLQTGKLYSSLLAAFYYGTWRFKILGSLIGTVRIQSFCGIRIIISKYILSDRL